jgi:hypothetical protein
MPWTVSPFAFTNDSANFLGSSLVLPLMYSLRCEGFLLSSSTLRGSSRHYKRFAVTLFLDLMRVLVIPLDARD